MIVVDASVLVDILLRREGLEAVETRLFASGESLHAPHFIDLEILHVIRRLALRGEIPQDRGALVVSRLGELSLTRYQHGPLIARIWSLRHNVSAYDAAYVALAEALEAPLLTRDRRLATASGHRARIEAV